MSRLTIYKENFHGSTTISNIFIDEYLETANDCEIKVYLYLVRMLSANKDISIYDMVEKFNHTEADIMHSLRYWEKKGLLVLDFDEYNVISAIHMKDLTKCSTKQAEAVPVNAEASTPAVKAAAPMPAPVAVVPTKPAYSAADLKQFKERAGVSEFLFVAASYIGRPLTPSELSTLLFIIDELKFSRDLADYLIQHCVGLGKKDFRYIEKVALAWAEAGVKTPEEATNMGGKHDKDVYAIMNRLGRNTTPTDVELAYINRWSKEYGFSTDIIFEACDRTVLKTESNRFEYADAILTKWKNVQITNFEDIKHLDDTHKAGKPKKKSSSIPSGNYDWSELEKQLLSN